MGGPIKTTSPGSFGKVTRNFTMVHTQYMMEGLEMVAQSDEEVRRTTMLNCSAVAFNLSHLNIMTERSKSQS